MVTNHLHHPGMISDDPESRLSELLEILQFFQQQSEGGATGCLNLETWQDNKKVAAPENL